MFKKVGIILLAVALLIGLMAIPAMAQEEEDDPVEIYFFPGGSPGGTFATVVYNGALKAEEILGDRVNVHYRWSEWSPQQMVTQFEQAIAADPDGIAIMGHPGDEAYSDFVDDAVDKGIIVTSQNTTLPELEAKYKGEGFGYVGQELYPSGQLLGEGCVNRFDLGEGDKALVWGLKSKPTRGQRTQGVIDALEDAGLEVDYMEISAEVDKDASNGISVIVGYLQANPDCDLIVTDHGNLTSSLQTYIESAGLGPDDIIGAGFDLSAATAEGIKNGYTDLVLDQQPFLQGFLPIFQIYLTEKWGFSGLHIDTGAGLIHEGNIDMIAPLAEEGIR
ncbi:MAG: substrate-binding domain-containing protein [Bacillota bacterium]